MSAPFIIPFNNEPTLSTTVRTANYTVPSGKYARFIPISYHNTWSIPINSTGLQMVEGIRLNGVYTASKSFSFSASMSSNSARSNWLIPPSGPVTNAFLHHQGPNGSIQYAYTAGVAEISVTATNTTANYQSGGAEFCPG